MTSGFAGSGVIGLPPNVKEGGQRVDFKVLNKQNATAFDLMIETKCPRFAWARASLCPCVGPNQQADQPDPGCTLCNAVGWLYFTPHEYVSDPDKIGTLDATQCALIEKANAVVIKALVVSATHQPDIYTVLGKWALGSSQCTVRPGNRLGYFDRLIGIDDEMVFTEVVEADGTNVLPTRYPVVILNLVRDLTTVFNDTEVCLVDGVITWNATFVPAKGTRISIHYIARPVWVVLEHTKLNRTTLVKQKKPNPTTPQGDIVMLPQQTLIRLEHLPLDPP